MTHTFNLDSMGLTSLPTEETINLQGGNWLWDVLRAIGVEKAIDYAIDHREDIGGFLSYMVKNPIRPSEYR